jgi:hypothetical protein
MDCTFVSWITPDYLPLQEGIRADCEKYAYPFFSEVKEKEFTHLANAFAYKPFFIKKCLEKFGKIAFVDAEIRILRALPEKWLASSLLFPKITPAFLHNILLFHHTGFFVMDRSALPLVDAWIACVERWNLQTAPKHTIDLRPESIWHISDETALCAAMSALKIFPEEIAVSWTPPPNLGREEMRFGTIANEHTFLTHSFLHHWTQERFGFSEYEYYRMYRYHYAGDFRKVAARMAESSERFEDHGWIFDSKNKTYAPKEYFSARQAIWDQAKHDTWERTW